LRNCENVDARRKAISGAKVLVLGIPSGKGVNNLGKCPALTVVKLLRRRGVDVSYNDPYFEFMGMDITKTPTWLVRRSTTWEDLIACLLCPTILGMTTFGLRPNHSL
jgi:UDP-N-acetyl-D-mannosaminuronate dehydrogenase